MPGFSRALDFSLITLLVGCTDRGPEQSSTTGEVLSRQATLPLPGYARGGPVTLLTTEQAPVPGMPRLHGWEYAARARRSLGALAQHVSIQPGAVAWFKMEEKATITKAAVAKALQKRGLILRSLDPSDTGWLLECTYFN